MMDVPLTSAIVSPADLSAGVSTAGQGGLGTPNLSPTTGAPLSPQVSAMQYAPGANQRLKRNPMLPQHPTDVALDSQYAAQEAMLRAQVSKQYADILQQLGYSDDQGNFIPGSVETNAALAHNELNRSSDLAADDVTRQAQQQGTLFSGLRGTAQARAQHPFQRQIARLGIDTPMQIAQLYENASGLIDNYSLQNNQYLAAAAQRKAQALAQAGGVEAAPQMMSAPGAEAAPASIPMQVPDSYFADFRGDNPISDPSLAAAIQASRPAAVAKPKTPFIGDSAISALAQALSSGAYKPPGADRYTGFNPVGI